VDENGDPLHSRREGTPPAFIGYAPRSNELEVITWNSQARKYDFLIVSDYREGGTPRIQKADSSVCMTCHQNGGPLLSRGLWAEMGGVTTGDAFEKLKFDPNTPGIPKNSRNNTNDIDDLVRVANDQLQANQVCASGCGDTIKCREKLLLGALARVQLASDPTHRKNLSQDLSQMVQSTWPKDEYAYPSDVLPNRDPTWLPEHHGEVTRVQIVDLKKFLAQGRGTDPQGNPIEPLPLDQYRIESEYNAGIELTYSHDHPAVDPEFALDPTVLKAIKLPYDDPSSLGDPTIKRPKVSAVPAFLAGEYLLDHVTDCFNLSDQDEAFLKKVPYEKLQNIAKDSTTGEFVASWPPNRNRIMAYIRARLSGTPVTNDILCPNNQLSAAPLSGAAAKAVSTVTHIAQRVPPKGALEVFQVYCGRCHAGPNALVEDFGIKSLSDLKHFKPFMIEGKINDGTMPADLNSYSEEKKEDWDRDKKVLLEELK
jgi:hypothetical protein